MYSPEFLRLNVEFFRHYLVKMPTIFTWSYVDKHIYNVLQFGYTHILEYDAI